MKKIFIGAGLLSVFAVSEAATSVELYGVVNVAAVKSNSGVRVESQGNRYASRLGIKGREELGGGYAAIFKLESEIKPDTGVGTYGANQKEFGFNRESWVGVITPVGSFRVGRSTTPMVNFWMGGGYGYGRGVGEFLGGVTGAGMRATQPETGIRWNNGLFYDIVKGGFNAGLAVTTKGSESIVPTRPRNLYNDDGSLLALATLPVDNEGRHGSKPAYGAYARYAGTSGLWNYKLGGAYQVDNGSSYSASSNTKNAPVEGKSMWNVGAGLGYGPVSIRGGYAETTIDNTSFMVASAPLRSGKSKTVYVGMGYDITARDKIYASYGRYTRNNQLIYSAALPIFGDNDLAASQVSFGYEHALSKRTVLYTNARKLFAVRNNCSASTSLSNSSPYYGVAIKGGERGCSATTNAVRVALAPEQGYSYDIGISHSF